MKKAGVISCPKCMPLIAQFFFLWSQVHVLIIQIVNTYCVISDNWHFLMAQTEIFLVPSTCPYYTSCEYLLHCKCIWRPAVLDGTNRDFSGPKYTSLLYLLWIPIALIWQPTVLDGTNRDFSDPKYTSLLCWLLICVNHTWQHKVLDDTNRCGLWVFLCVCRIC